MSKEPLSEAIQHYLRAIYGLGSGGARVTVSRHCGDGTALPAPRPR